jgi:hypothetical protein
MGFGHSNYIVPKKIHNCKRQMGLNLALAALRRFADTCFSEAMGCFAHQLGSFGNLLAS